MVNQVEIPDKDGFKIGEVSKLLGLESYVLRYWETEFKALKPKKNAQRPAFISSFGY